MVTFNVTDWVKTHEDVTSLNSNDENNDDVENYNEDGKYHEISDEQRDQIGQYYYLHLFGKTTDNKSIYVKVSGFKPHFYVEIPKSWSNINAKHFFDHVKSSLPRIFQNNLVGYTVMSRHKFYYFTANELFNFIRFEFDNENAMRRCNYIFNKPIRVLGLCNPTLFQVFESNIFFFFFFFFNYMVDLQQKLGLKLIGQILKNMILQILVNLKLCHLILNAQV